MKIITLTNPTDIAGVAEYKEAFWVPSVQEHRELAVWREADASYAYSYIEEFATGFATAQAAYEAGVAVVIAVTPDVAVPQW